MDWTFGIQFFCPWFRNGRSGCEAIAVERFLTLQDPIRPRGHLVTHVLIQFPFDIIRRLGRAGRGRRAPSLL